LAAHPRQVAFRVFDGQHTRICTGQSNPKRETGNNPKLIQPSSKKMHTLENLQQARTRKVTEKSQNYITLKETCQNNLKTTSLLEKQAETIPKLYHSRRNNPEQPQTPYWLWCHGDARLTSNSYYSRKNRAQQLTETCQNNLKTTSLLEKQAETTPKLYHSRRNSPEQPQTPYWLWCHGDTGQINIKLTLFSKKQGTTAYRNMPE
jgi:hypothetical protein